MKILIQADTIRYRLTHPELEQFVLTGMVKEETHFGHKILTCILRKTNQQQIMADYNNDTITVFMPANMASEWESTARAGFENEQNGLSIYIEKDMANADEDRGDGQN